jgi:Ca2+-binding EF-hand superfamily protein
MGKQASVEKTLAQLQSSLAWAKDMTADKQKRRAFAREEFHKADADKSGTLDKDEILKVLEDVAHAFHLDLPKKEKILALYDMCDKNGDGVLDTVELRALLKKSGFKLSDEIVSQIMSSADTNGDGVIQLNEFCKAGLALQAVGFPVGEAPAAPAAPVMPALADVPAAQLEEYMKRLFKIGDRNNDGVLDALELRDLLRNSGFNLDDETIQTIMVAVDINKDGVIQFDEFCVAVAGLVTGLGQSQSQMLDIHSVNKLELRSYFQRLFKIGDTNGDGVLQPEEFANLLRQSGFNFDPAQIQEISRAADVNGDGLIQYEEFVPALMAIATAKRPDPVKAPGMPSVTSVPPEQLELYFQKLFALGDKDGNGVLDAIEFRNLLRKSGFGFDDQTISKIMVAADTNKDGVIQYDEFKPIMKDLIRGMPRPI